MPSSTSILAEIFVFDLLFYFDVIIHQRLKKSSIQLIFFFSRANEAKIYGFVPQLILRMPRDLILQQRNFQFYNGDVNFKATFSSIAHMNDLESYYYPSWSNVPFLCP